MNVRLLSTVGLVAVAGALVVAGCSSSDDSSPAPGGSGNGGTSVGGTSSGGSAGHAGGATGGTAGATGGTGGASAGTGGATGGTGGASAGTGGATGGTGGATGGTGGASSGVAGEGGAAGDSGGNQSEVIYDFESGTQNWSADATVTLVQDTAEAFDGTHSLKITVPAIPLSMNLSVKATAPTIVPVYGGSVVTFHLWVPAGTGDGLYVQGYSQTQNYSYFDPGAGPPAHNGNATSNTLVRGGWSTITYTVPPTYPGGLQELGIQIGVGATGTGFAGGDFYLDSISVSGGNTSCSGAGTGTYDFETAGDVMAWAVDGSPAPTDTVISQSTDQAVTGGTGSLKVAFTALPAAASATAPTQRDIFFGQPNGSPNAFCGQTITFNVWTPAGSDNLSFVAYAQTGWFAGFPTAPPTTITRGDWTQWTFTLPNPINPLGLQRIGVQFNYTDTTAPFTGNVYIDKVTW